MKQNNLPPLTDSLLDGFKQTFEEKPIKCNHKFIIINSKEIRCTVCGFGLTGNGVISLIDK